MRLVEPQPWIDFLRELSRLTEAFRQKEIIWFRGHPSATFSLLPSLLRTPLGVSKEQAFYDAYSQWSPRMEGRGVPNDQTDWDLLYDMHHFGIPTRLLDWTEVLGVAVFFALAGPADEDAVVYALDPITLNSKVNRPGLISETDFSYRAIYWKSDPFSPSTPLALNPRHQNHRLAAQRGRFTAHGTDLKSLEKIAPECVRRIVLTRAAKPAARQFLEFAGINAYSTFPDVTGVAPFVKSIVGL